jgi:hypothetical protein
VGDTPKVHLGAARVELHLPGIRSLKGKRALVQPIVAAWRDQLGASVAEVGFQDSWQRACLGVSVAASSPTNVDRVLERVRPLAERDPRVVVTSLVLIVDTLTEDDGG